jgi:hypothetical protein
MPGFLLHVGAIVQCSHGGMAQPLSPNPRVLVSGQPIVTLASQYAIAGCAFPPVSGGPCVTAQFVVGATRVLATGVLVLLQTGVAVCVPTGTPLIVGATQTRVTGI